MKALSVQQPWAWLIVNGYKPIENRTWRTSYRGPVLIHAPARVDHRATLEVRRAPGGWQGIDIPVDLPTGGIVGVATIVDCVTDYPSRWFDGPFGFVLAQARPLPFVPCRGALGLWTVPDKLMEQVRRVGFGDG